MATKNISPRSATLHLIAAIPFKKKQCEFRGSGCLGEFQPASGNHKFCRVCRKAAYETANKGPARSQAVRYQADIDEILRRRDEGQSVAQIARELGTSRYFIRRKLKEAGEPLVGRRVSREQWANFKQYRDPGYEARNDMAHKVVCRECGRFMNRILSSHTRTHQVSDGKGGSRPMMVCDYKHKYPGCLASSYDAMLHTTPAKIRPTLKEYVAAGAAKYLTPAEMVIHLSNCLYEIKNKTDYAACRLCGLKCSYALGEHTRRIHHCTQRQYHHQFPGAPWLAPKFQERRSQKARSFWFRMGSRPKEWKDWTADKKMIYMLLVEHPGISYVELGELLDKARLIPCPYGNSWARVLSDRKAKGHGAAMTYISKIRNPPE